MDDGKETEDGGDRMTDRSHRLLIYLIGLNTALLVASNAGGAKIIAVYGGLAASATVFSYALSFTFTDVISEVFGPEKARLTVQVGFLGVIVSVLFFKVAVWAPAAPTWGGQAAYEATLGMGPRLLAGGWTSYMVSQHLDVWVFHTLKRLTRGRHLWLRNNLSTAISQFVDTCIFITIAFHGVVPLWPTILGQYVFKLLIAAVDTPIVYLAVRQVRKHIGDQGSQGNHRSS
jgi:uncharacterized integral membrane protein (TIGR00697 family)